MPRPLRVRRGGGGGWADAPTHPSLRCDGRPGGHFRGRNLGRLGNTSSKWPKYQRGSVGIASLCVRRRDDDGRWRWPTRPRTYRSAWENLDLSRNIASRLIGSFRVAGGDDEAAGKRAEPDGKSEEGPASATEGTDFEQANGGAPRCCSTSPRSAQIHVRPDDLRRANADFLPCIDDYSSALALRTKVLGPFDWKVAGVHFGLAAVYAEAPQR